MNDEKNVATNRIDETQKCSPVSYHQKRVLVAFQNIQESDITSIVYQHTVLCQTCLPYRDPGNEVRYWERKNGQISLRLRAGEALHPKLGWIEVGLPFGPKPRLILCYLNTQALLKKSPVIDVEDSLTAFTKRIGIDANGRNIKLIKDQLARLCAADIRLGVRINDESSSNFKGQIVSEFNLWFTNDDGQRLLWPNMIRLDKNYFESLCQHAVPLDERALIAISHSAMALDIYAWLAQRLHRIKIDEKIFVSWDALYLQFGLGYSRKRKFREVFQVALRQVMTVYPDAKVDLGADGLFAHYSNPPVRHRIWQLPKIEAVSEPPPQSDRG